jgi:HPt (histidine-containing phosphotransfer) domain-containing protein
MPLITPRKVRKMPTFSTEHLPLNLVAIDQLRVVFDNDDEIVEFIREQSFPLIAARLAELRKAIEQRDAVAVPKLAHEIRGGAASIGADAVVAAMFAIESEVKRSRWDELLPPWSSADDTIQKIGHWLDEENRDR